MPCWECRNAYVAILKRHDDCLDAFEKPQDKRDSNGKLMAFAAYWGNTNAMKILLRDGHLVDHRAFNAAAIVGQLGPINLLLHQKRFLVPRTVIELASSKGYINILERIAGTPSVDIGFNALGLLNTPRAIAFAAEAGRIEVLEYIFYATNEMRKKRKLEKLPLFMRPPSHLLKAIEIPAPAMILAGRKAHLEVMKLLHKNGALICNFTIKMVADGIPSLRLPATVHKASELFQDASAYARANACVCCAMPPPFPLSLSWKSTSAIWNVFDFCVTQEFNSRTEFVMCFLINAAASRLLVKRAAVVSSWRLIKHVSCAQSRHSFATTSRRKRYRLKWSN